jgi:hypothetical protein
LAHSDDEKKAAPPARIVAAATAECEVTDMVLRIILFRLRPDFSDYDSRLLLTSIHGTVKSVPGLLSFNVGKRMEEGSYQVGPAEGGGPEPYDYAAVFQFESEKALQTYLTHPAQKELRARFAAVVSSAITSDYLM